MADQLHYTLPNTPHAHSGRGLRFRILKSKERDALLMKTAILADGDHAKHSLLRWREGGIAMLQKCTKKTGLTDEQACDPSTEWMDLNQQILAEQYDDLFTAADDELITALYRQYHEPTQAVTGAILGKVRVVSTG